MKTLFKLWLAIWFQMIAPAFSMIHSVGVTYKTPEGTITNTTDSFSGDGAAEVDTTVPASTVDQVEACSVLIAKLVSCCVFSALATTVKTYAAGVLKDTIALAAGKQLVWTNTSNFANPFSHDFDTIKVSNADLTKATSFKARFLLTD